MFTFLLVSPAFAWSPWTSAFHDTIARVEGMVHDGETNRLANRHGLRVLNVTWEDTGRYKGSAVGPNISDMTIGVRDANDALHPMPVFRFDNFRDKTADLASDDFWLRVGNERGRSLRTITLADLLQDTRRYLHDPSSWAGGRGSLWSDRDREVLVSAQACFLPIPKSGEATFTPVLYNYQSYPGNPAVLAIVATREGTSMQVVQNEGGYLSQELYFNEDGDRAPFTAERASDWQGGGGGSAAASDDSGLNVVLLIQVPLKQRELRRSYGDWGLDESMGGSSAMSAPMAEKSDVENAVVSHGPVEGPFTEIDDLAIERDTRFPVRVTVQFYKATSNGVVTDADVRAIRRQIDRVYASSDWVGSLVTEGHTGRSTEWYPQAQPTWTEPDDGGANWADPFWTWHKAN
jgi:hypothetical protein